MSDETEVGHGENNTGMNREMHYGIESDPDDHAFRPWNVTGMEQCGNHRFVGTSAETEADTFKVLYEHDEEDMTFRRLYELGRDDGQSDEGPTDDADEFIPFAAHGKGRSLISSDSGTEEIMETATQGTASQSRSRAFDPSGAPPLSNSDDVQQESEFGDPEGEFEEVSFPEVSVDEPSGGEQGALQTDGSHPGGVPGESSPVSQAELNAALEEGFNTGFEEGKKQGFEAGFEEGREQGYQEGLGKGEEAGYDAGLEKGEEDGKMLSDAKAQELLLSLDDICQKADQAWQTMVQKSEAQILSLIGKIAEKVVYATVDLSEEVVRGSILEALSVMPEPEEIVLNISPEDYEYIEMVKEDFFEEFKTLRHVSVISNPAIQRGGCKIESSKGRVETDIATRLEAVTAGMMAARSS